MDFLKTAKKNAKLLALYKEIEAWKTIVPEKSGSSSSEWGSYIDDAGNAVVVYAKTKNKECCLAHEVLHFYTQMSGYRRMMSCTTTLDAGQLKRLVDCLDNELQHHRMFGRFQELGYPPKWFYNDDDDGTARYLDRVLNNYREPNLLAVIPDYMTLIAPGGSLTKRERDDFSARFRRLAKSAHAFDTIDEAISEWKMLDAFDQEKVVSKIMSVIPGDHSSWIGFDDGSGFPNTGFFAGEPLSFEDYAKAMASGRAT